MLKIDEICSRALISRSLTADFCLADELTSSIWPRHPRDSKDPAAGDCSRDAEKKQRKFC